MTVVKGADGKYHRVKTEDLPQPTLTQDLPLAKVEDKRLPVSAKVRYALCEGCPMASRPLCSPDRVRRADVVIIGEGPGTNEIDQQEFFVGRAGQLLHAGIEQTRLGESSIVINNATLCLPRDDFTVEALWHCRYRLLDEVRECEPELIVAIGAQALSSLWGRVVGITEFQGLVFDYCFEVIEPEYFDEMEENFEYNYWDSRLLPKVVKLVPCFHSAFVLRNPSAFYDFMNALVKAHMVAIKDSTADVQPEQFERHIANAGNVLELLERVVAYPHIYMDLETTGYNPFKDAIICVSFAGRRDDSAVAELGVTFDWGLFEANSKALGLLIKTLERRVVGYWNGMFDCLFAQEYGIKAKVGHDIMLKQYTLDERPMSQGLKPSARRTHNAPDWEAPLRAHLSKRSDSYALIPFEVLAQYATLDACYTGTMDSYVTQRMSPSNTWVYDNILIPATNMFIDVTRRGLPVDVSQLEVVHKEMSSQLDDLLWKLRDSIGDYKFNPSSVRDAKYLCYDLLNLPVRGRLRGSTQREAVEPFRDQYEEVGWLLDFRSTRKMVGTYLEGILEELDDNNVWHPNIRVSGTVTGRLASGQGKGERSRKAVNALGVPKEKGGIKKLVVAPKGRLMLEGDGGQMELRTLGALSNDKNMIKDFRSGRDFHGIARHRMFGRGYGKENYTHQEVLDAKTIVFGPPYGRGPESMAEQMRCSLKEVEEFLEAIWGPYPDAWAWLEARVQELKNTGEVKSHYGRVRHWGLLTPESFEPASKEARNFGVQSAATDTNLLIMIGLYETGDLDLIFPLLPTHDAILNDIDENRPKEAKRVFKEYAEHKAQELLNTEMPFVYDIGIGQSWGDC